MNFSIFAKLTTFQPPYEDIFWLINGAGHLGYVMGASTALERYENGKLWVSYGGAYMMNFSIFFNTHYMQPWHRCEDVYWLVVGAGNLVHTIEASAALWTVWKGWVTVEICFWICWYFDFFKTHNVPTARAQEWICFGSIVGADVLMLTMKTSTALWTVWKGWNIDELWLCVEIFIFSKITKKWQPPWGSYGTVNSDDN